MTEPDEVLKVTDTKVLTAMTHPLRRRLLDLLLVEGPATASLLAERTDQAVGNVSHHLRVLADSGLVTEAPELARDRRERWWRRAVRAVSWDSTDFAGDAAAEAIELAAVSMNLDRQGEYVRAWNAAGGPERDRWGNHPFASASWLRLTPEELGEYGRELREFMERWRDRQAPDDGQQRRPVYTFAYGLPARP